MLPGLCKLASLKQCKSLFGSLSGARRRANGILTAVKSQELTEIVLQSDKKKGAGNPAPLSHILFSTIKMQLFSSAADARNRPASYSPAMRAGL
jgi:hypothetical protein